MNRGLIWSAALHGTLFVVFLLGPGPQALDWDRADAVSVDLVSLPQPEPPKELPVEAPKAPPSLPDPEPEPVVQPPAPELTPDPPAPEVTPDPPAPEVAKPSPPEPKPAKTTTPPPPQRVFKKYAPPKEDDEPSLAERLQQRLAAAGSEAPPSSAPEAPGPADVPVAEETVLPAASTAHVEAVNFPYEWYLNVLRTKITAVWDPPGQRLIAGRERQVVIRFRVHRDGRVTQISTDGASGTPGLDESARRAVERGGPFPPLPPNYEGDWLDVAVRFTVEGG